MTNERRIGRAMIDQVDNGRHASGPAAQAWTWITARAARRVAACAAGVATGAATACAADTAASRTPAHTAAQNMMRITRVPFAFEVSA